MPSVWPEAFPFLHPVEVDTDPENMLPEDAAVRVFHDAMKKEMSLYDIVVLGVVNESDPDGVFNPESLKRIYELAEYAKTLHWPDEKNPEKRAGVVEVDLIAPSTVDNIEPGGLGEVNRTTRIYYDMLKDTKFLKFSVASKIPSAASSA